MDAVVLQSCLEQEAFGFDIGEVESGKKVLQCAA